MIDHFVRPAEIQSQGHMPNIKILREKFCFVRSLHISPTAEMKFQCLHDHVHRVYLVPFRD